VIGRRLAATLVAPLALPLLATAQEVLEISLTFEKSAEQEDSTPWGSAHVTIQARRPAGLAVAPEFVSAKPYFGTLPLGDDEFLFALDASEEGGTRYDTVYFDRDRDGDLSDEEVLEGRVIEIPEANVWFVQFEDTISVEYSLDGVVLPYELEVSLQGQDLEKLLEGLPEGFDASALMSHAGVHARFETGCFCAATVSLGGVDYRLRLGDSDCDGRFGETAYVDDEVQYVGDEFYAQGDSFWLTGAEEFTWEDSILFGDHLVVGGEVFRVGVSTTERKLTLTPLSEGLSPLELACEPERLVVHTKGFEHTVMMIEPGAAVRLPAGEYRIVSYTMLRTGEAGDRWRIGAQGTKSSPFVAAGGGAKLLFGDPYTASASVPEWYRSRLEEQEDGLEVRLDFAIRGAGAESVSQLDWIGGSPSACPMSAEDDTQPLEPTYTVVKKTGEQVAKASFEYG